MATLFKVSFNDTALRASIVQIARAAGRTLKEQTRLVMKYMVRQGFEITPPAGNSTGKEAQRAGEGAIRRDLYLMGFVPVTIKGYRMQTQAFGHSIIPVKVLAHGDFLKEEVSSQAETDIIHRLRLASQHGGFGVTRGRAKPWFIRKSYVSALRSRLYGEVGRLASWLVPAAITLGVPVPAWIARHGFTGRGTELQVNETETKISMRVTGHFPETTGSLADEVQRRIDYLKLYAINALKRQLPYLLGRAARAAKSKQ